MVRKPSKEMDTPSVTIGKGEALVNGMGNACCGLETVACKTLKEVSTLSGQGKALMDMMGRQLCCSSPLLSVSPTC